MKEEFLHYLWQFQKFDARALKTINRESVTILQKGFINTDSGPDFSNARIKINEIEWAGHVEIHLKSSDWLRHEHQQDEAYQNVILHVVWEHDKAIINADGKEIPCLELKELTSDLVLKGYSSLMNSAEQIPCQKLFSKVSELQKMAMLDKALMQRLQRKGEAIEQRANQNAGDWQEALYQTLLANFGFKLNTEAFLHLAEKAPFKLLRKYQNSAFRLEALLFGMAGFLEEADGEYASKLKSEFNFLKAKHSLEELHAAQWKFMRTRPGNFPTVRISQLVALLSQQKSFVDLFITSESLEELRLFFGGKPTDYWQKHYHFGKKAQKTLNGIGKSSIENLLVNTVVPFLIAYAHYSDDQKLIDKAIKLLESISAEKNRITRFWQEMGLQIEKMTDSQGSIELYNEFCLKKKCLHCGIGVELLN